jgi:hypothetical protein
MWFTDEWRNEKYIISAQPRVFFIQILECKKAIFKKCKSVKDAIECECKHISPCPYRTPMAKALAINDYKKEGESKCFEQCPINFEALNKKELGKIFKVTAPKKKAKKKKNARKKNSNMGRPTTRGKKADINHFRKLLGGE